MRDAANTTWQAMARVALGAMLLGSTLAFAQAPPAQELRHAFRTDSAGAAPRSITLPDQLDTERDGDRLLTPTYRLAADLGAEQQRTAIYMPGVFAHACVSVNGHTVADRIREPLPPRPRGADRMLLATVPAEFLRPGVNDIEVTLAATRQTSVSRLWIGDEDTLRRMYLRMQLLTVTGPVVAAAVIMALSLCVLVLWARRPGDALYGYFGIGGLLWALHTVWTVLPDPLLPPPHLAIWWTLGYPFFVAPLVIFCVRLAQWRVPRFERSLWIGLAVGPGVLYGAHFAGVLDPALDYWRLVWIGAVAVGVFAVGRYALQRRDTQACCCSAPVQWRSRSPCAIGCSTRTCRTTTRCS